MSGLGAVPVLAAGDDQQKAAPLGLLVLLLLGVACYFLFRSMSRHLKRVRDEFPIGLAAQGTAAQGTAAQRPVAQRPVAQRPVAQAPAAPGSAAPGSADPRPMAAGPARPIRSGRDGAGPDLDETTDPPQH